MTHITNFVSGLEFTCKVSAIRMIAERRHTVYLSVQMHCSLFLLFMNFSRGSLQKTGLLGVRVLPPICTHSLWHDLSHYSWHPTEESCQEKLKCLALKMFSETLSLDLKISFSICLLDSSWHLAALC